MNDVTEALLPIRQAPFPLALDAVRSRRYAAYALLHDLSDVFSFPGRRAFVVTGHSWVLQGLGDSSFQSDRRDKFFEQLEQEHPIDLETRRRLEFIYGGWLMCMDPPAHPVYRAGVSSVLGGLINDHRASWQEEARACSELQEACDLVSGKIEPYVHRCLSALFGLDPAIYRSMIADSKVILEFFLGHTQPGEAGVRELLDAYDRMQQAFSSARPGGLVTGVLDAFPAEDSRRFPLVVMLVADTWEPTVALIGAGILHGLSAAWGQPLLSPSLNIRSFFQEVARFESPFQLCDRMVGGKGAKLGDLTFAPGDSVCFLIGAANRDPRAFPNPDVFDPTRESRTRQTAFGAGPHACIGGRLSYELSSAYWMAARANALQHPWTIEGHAWKNELGMRLLERLEATPFARV